MKKKYILYILIIIILSIVGYVTVRSRVIENTYDGILRQFVGEPIAEDGTINNRYFGMNSEENDANGTTKGINKAIEYANKNNIEYIKLEKGNYLINGISTNVNYNEVAVKKGIILQSNITLDLNNSVLKHVKNSAVNYAIISITDVKNVKITNGSIEGDRYVHDYETKKSTHEWGFGVDIRGSKQVEIVNVQIHKTTGDGIIVCDYTNGEISEDIKIANCNIWDCRRQGISIVCANNVELFQNEIHDINGTEPQAGIDIEPFPGLQKVHNILIKENIFYNFASGRAIAFLGESSEIVIENNDIRNSGIISSGFKGNAYIRNNKITKGSIWIYQSVDEENKRNEKIVIENNNIIDSQVTLFNIANVVLENNEIENKGIRIASSNVAIYKNQFLTKGKEEYALEYSLTNYEKGNYSVYLYGNSYKGDYTNKEKILNNDRIKIDRNEEELKKFINK